MAKRKFYRKTGQKPKKKRAVFFLLKISAFAFLFFIFAFFFIFIYYAKDLPRPEVFSERQLPESSKIYDRTGETLLYEIYGEEKRTWVPLGQMPEHLKWAVVATEDASFYSHFGIDFKGIARSVLTNLKIRKAAAGGSTIPQQLIRSTFLTPKKTVERKTREIILAIELDRRYSKDQILEWYLNQIPLGQNAYGVEAASQTYFGKHVWEISLEESAALAALIRAPSSLSPYRENKEDLLARKDYVLSRMEKIGHLTEEEKEAAKKEELKFMEKKVSLNAPYFTLWVKQTLEQKYGADFLRENGLKIYTSLDWKMQKIAEEETRNGIKRNKSSNVFNAGMVAIDPKNGEILAMAVGDGDYYSKPLPEGCLAGATCLFDPKFNVVIGSEKNPGRQPGSSFKPFVYLTAFEKGYSDKYVVEDASTSFGIWGGKEYVPQNYDGKFRGPVTLREALAQSLNIPAVKTLLDLAGIEDSVKTAQSLGISTLNPPYGPSIVLGGWEVKLIEMVFAYGVFATDGFRVEPVPVLRIEDQNGNIIFENKKTQKRVLESEPIRLLNDILSDNEARTPLFGPNSALYFPDYQVAVKTGTTQDYRDAWTVGYTPSIAVGVWAGNNNGQPTTKPGAMLTAPIWHNFLAKVLPTFPKENFPKPELSENGIQAATTSAI